MLTEINDELYRDSGTKKPLRWKAVGLSFVCISAAFVVGVALWVYHQLEPPTHFPTDTVLEIMPGTGVTRIAEQLHDDGYIRSPLLFKVWVAIQYEPSRLKAGRYQIQQPKTIPEILTLLTNVENGHRMVRLTHIEGQRVRQIAERAENVLVNFSKQEFIERAEPYEGLLFPDTYFVPETFTEEELFNLLRDTFEQRIEPIREDIDNHPLDEDEILVLASILEREANSSTTKRMVSGILQNRLTIRMPLQADASIEYVLDKPLNELTPADLEIDSPYNTYTNFGLPPTPIGNPGLTAIHAVLDPIETEYLYYITGRDGTFHYAVDFDKHRENIQRYLR